MIRSKHMANMAKVKRVPSGVRSQEAKILLCEAHVLEQEAKESAKCSFLLWAWPRMSWELRAFVAEKVKFRNGIRNWVDVVNALMQADRDSAKKDVDRRARICYICKREGHEAEKCWGDLRERKRAESSRRCVVPVKHADSNKEIVENESELDEKRRKLEGEKVII